MAVVSIQQEKLHGTTACDCNELVSRRYLLRVLSAFVSHFISRQAGKHLRMRSHRLSEVVNLQMRSLATETSSISRDKLDGTTIRDLNEPVSD